MLYKDDRYMDTAGRVYRLLAVDVPADSAWVISMEARHAWPEHRAWSEISALSGLNTPTTHPVRNHADCSHAQKLRAKNALEAIAPLVENIPSIFIPEQRSSLLNERADEIGICQRTLRNYLREYWLGGQTESALLGKWHNCGVQSAILNQTARRGRRPLYGDYEIFEVDQSVHAKFEEAAKWYLKDERHTISAAFDALLEHYTTPDGILYPMGQRPSQRQFSYYLQNKFSTEVRLRARKGDKEFERNHRAKLGSSRFQCDGVGDIYEIDATIADIYLVAKDDATKIIGKPTVYLIIDRRSGLITGFYAGLENASWSAARLAILSITADKAELCRKYGVTYNPEEWPAHGIMPKQFVADRGEIYSKASNRLTEGLHTTVANVPGLRPDWKPFVECGFKLLHQALAKDVPGYDPDWNATRRRGKHYEKDASLTLHDFTKLLLEYIITYNRKPKLKMELATDEVMNGISAAPIPLWNYGIKTRSGYLTRTQEHDVKFALLPTEEATITPNGIEFKGCYYTCEEAIKKGWFVQARKGRKSVDVSFDPRLSDAIYVHKRGDKCSYIRADMTDVSRRKYAGLTFNEVDYYLKLEKRDRADDKQVRYQVEIERRQRSRPTIESSQNKLARMPKTSRSARRADIKEDRHEELLQERRVTAAPLPRTQTAVVTQIQQAGLECSEMQAPVHMTPLDVALARSFARMNGN